VQAAGVLADVGGQSPLDERVDILPSRVEGHRARLELRPDRAQARSDALRRGQRQDALPRQHATVGEAAEDVLRVKADVEGQ
jgi:hypothetical protein